MEANSTVSISYFLKVNHKHLETLADLRKWGHLKVAFDADEVWITGFKFAQIESATIKTLPYKELFYTENGKLFPLGSLLPIGREPAFLWSDIERAFPIVINDQNHHYFGVNETLEIKFVPDDQERVACAMVVSLENLGRFINTAPDIRIKNLKWMVFGQSKAFLIGSPLLPIPGDVFWNDGNGFIPIGWRFHMPFIMDLVSQKINPNKEKQILWKPDASYLAFDNHLLKKLSISSYRKTIDELYINSL